MIQKGTEPAEPQGEQDPMLLSAAEDLLSAIAMKDASGVAQALQAAFDMCDSMEESEGNFNSTEG